MIKARKPFRTSVTTMTSIRLRQMRLTMADMILRMITVIYQVFWGF
jgi:hypothetical protein